MVIKSVKDLEKAISNLSDGETIEIDTLSLTHDADIRLRYYIADGVLIPTKKTFDRVPLELHDLVKSGKWVCAVAEYAKAPSAQFIIDTVECGYAGLIEHLEERNLELTAKNDELDTQLLQYQTYVADLTTAIQKNICKDFCPNIKPLVN